MRPFHAVRPLLLALALGAAAAAGATGPDAAGHLFEEGNRLLDAGDAAGAEAAYRAAAATGWTGAALEHNRGLAALQAGDVGAAVLYFRRAERLSPDDARIRQSLDAALADARLAAPPEGAGWHWARLAARPAGAGGLLALAAVLGLVAAFRWRAPATRRSATAVGVTAAALWALAAAAWVATAPRAVVLEATSLRTAPSSLAPEAAALTAGRRLRLGEQVGHWQSARLSDGTAGWVARSAIGAMSDE